MGLHQGEEAVVPLKAPTDPSLIYPPLNFNFCVHPSEVWHDKDSPSLNHIAALHCMTIVNSSTLFRRLPCGSQVHVPLSPRVDVRGERGHRCSSRRGRSMPRTEIWIKCPCHPRQKVVFSYMLYITYLFCLE
jgi:hypothetical protein